MSTQPQITPDQLALLSSLLREEILAVPLQAGQAGRAFINRLTGFGYCTTISREQVALADALHVFSHSLTFEEAGVPRLSFEVSAAGAMAIHGALTASSSGNAAPRQIRLSEPQRSLVDKIKSGARLQHDQTGLYRLSEGVKQRTVNPATVSSLISAGVLAKGTGGLCYLA